MATRAKHAVQDVGVSTQLGLFEVLEVESAEPGTRNGEKARVDGGARSRSSSSTIRSLRQARDGRGALPRLCVKPEEAAQMLGVSRDYFDEHIKPELRIVRRGSRTILIPVAELVRWVERNAARWVA
jgi:excisionase family DNA binding protein